MLQPLLQLLLSQLGADVQAERHGAFRLGTVLGMVTAQGDQLFANRAAAVRLALAGSRVRHNALHLLARRQSAICVATLTSVHKRLDTPLNR